MDVNFSEWDCTLEGSWVLGLGSSVWDATAGLPGSAGVGGRGPGVGGQELGATAGLSNRAEEARVDKPPVAPTPPSSSPVPSPPSADPRPPSADPRPPALRLGLQMLQGMGEARPGRSSRRGPAAVRLAGGLCQADGPGRSAALRLAKAGAFGSLGLESPRGPLARPGPRSKDRPQDRPLLAGLEADGPTPVEIPPLTPAEEVLADYRTTGLSLAGAPAGVPWRGTGSAGRRSGPAACHAAQRRAGPGGGDRAGPSAARHRQGDHLRHLGRRDRSWPTW